MKPSGKPIFITARFRTGSTLLWSLFRRAEAFTAYYEPCHDNLIAYARVDSAVQDSHYGVHSYWDEYQPLMDRLSSLHRDEFGVSRLLLEGGDDWPELEAYLRFLVERSRLRPVLQFNRVDFRLPWLRRRFPEAAIVHLFRNPRDQWLSMVKEVPDDSIADPNENTNYDLVIWAASLSSSFPFLVGPHIRHSYERHYLLWKLSYLMGSRCADVSLSYDADFQDHPEVGVRKLLEAVGASPDIAPLWTGAIVHPVRPPRSGVPSPADFDSMEQSCNQLLDRLGLISRFGNATLAEIRRNCAPVWRPFEEQAPKEAARLACLVFSRLRSHYLDVVNRLRQVGRNSENVVNELAEREKQLRALNKT